MKLRCHISLDNGLTFPTEVFPVGIPSTVMRWARSAAFSALRADMKVPFVFSKKADYQMFRSIDATDRCTKILVRVDALCGQEWTELYKGQFLLVSGKWDYQKCTLEITLDPIDRYSCFEAGWGKRHNLMPVQPVESVTARPLPPGVEFLCTRLTTVGGNPLSAYGWVQGDQQSVTFPDLGSPGSLPCEHLPGETVLMRVYWRQRLDVPCALGTANAPGQNWFAVFPQDYPPQSGDSGALVQASSCPFNETATYVKQPSITWNFWGNPLYLGPVATRSIGEVPTYPEPTSEPNGPVENWIRVGERTTNCNSQGIFIGSGYRDITLAFVNRARKLSDVLAYLVGLLDCGIQGVRSDFLEINPVGDAVGYAPGINYVTGEDNKHNYLMLVQKSDAMFPDALEPAVRADYSLKELLEALQVSYQLEFDIDTDDHLRIEHTSYWRASVGLDITAMDSIESLAFAGVDSGIPKAERLLFEEAQGVDFVGKDVKYSGGCVRLGANELVYSVVGITTDLGYVVSSVDDIEPTGFVLLACRRYQTFPFPTDSAWVHSEFGAITGALLSNGPLSVANLQRDFWMHNRFLAAGNLNGEDVQFLSFRPTVEQKKVTVRCFGCAVLIFDPNASITTKLGNLWGGLPASIDNIELDIKGNLTFTPRYSR